jgi:hypothetical protein
MTSSELCRLLSVVDHRCVEVESKWRLPADAAKPLMRRLFELKGVEHEKSTTFLDQYLDTSDLRLLRGGASLRLRYRKSGAQVYLQYKGPGMRSDALHFRPEYRSENLDGLALEDTGDNLLRFEQPSVADILRTKAPAEMIEAMRRDLGHASVYSIDFASILCQYSKDVFRVELENVWLSPSIDRLCVFRLDRRGPLAMSTFGEYENEVRAGSLDAKLAALPALRAFDAALAAEFGLTPEPLDKYGRCASGLLRDAAVFQTTQAPESVPSEVSL